jgi:hypothetical protein
VPGQALEQIEIEAPAHHRGQRQHALGILVQPVGALPDSDLHRAWDVQLAQRLTIPLPTGIENIAGRDQRLQNLLDKKGIPLGQRVQRRQEIGANWPPLIEDHPQQRVNLGFAERRQPYFVGHSLTIQAREQVRQTRV